MPFRSSRVRSGKRRKCRSSLDFIRRDGQKSSGHGGSPLQKTNFSFIGHGTISWEVVAAAAVEVQAGVVGESVHCRRVVQNPV